MKRTLMAIGFFAGLVVLWEAMVRARLWSVVLVPSPLDVGKYLIAAIQDQTLLQASYVTMKRLLHTWVRVIVPASLPFIVSGMKQGWAFAWRSLMAAEIYVTILTGFGLGHLLHYGRELHAMDQVIGIMLVIIVIGLLADKLLFSPWERFLHRRWGTGRT